MTSQSDLTPTPRKQLKPIEFLLLGVLQEGPLHGYGLVREIERRTGGEVRAHPGDVYRVIYRLANRGLLERQHAGEDQGDPRRTYYQITTGGTETVAREARLLAKLAADVMRHVPGTSG